MKTNPRLPLGLQRRGARLLPRLVSGRMEDFGLPKPNHRIDDLAFIGLGQAIPTIFPFAECQSGLAGRWLGGDWALPTPAEMKAEIARDDRRYLRHHSSRPRHTMQLDYYVDEHDLRTRVIPAGQQRAQASAVARAPVTA